MMLIEMTGKRFNRWTVLSRGKTDRRKRIYWLCLCECGERREVEGTSLRTGLSRSCGCLSIEEVIDRETIHGMTGTKIHNTWKGMLTRCFNPASAAYENYGGRGIVVCERWLDFRNFYADMGDRPSPFHTLDRIDNDGIYEPSNCRWSLKTEQSSNRRNCVYVDTPEGRITTTEAARRAGISWYAMRARIKHNLPYDQLFAPARGKSIVS